MTSKQKLFHKSLIKSLHISKKYKEYFQYNKDDYQDFIEKHFGVTSSKDLDIDNLIIFVDFMNEKRDSLPLKRVPNDALCSEAQLKMMRSLWKNYATDTSDVALLTFTNRQNKKRYLHLHMMSKYEAQKIIPALKNMK